MTGPQKLKPRFFSALAMASLSGVFTGASRKVDQSFWIGAPPTKDQSRIGRSAIIITEKAMMARPITTL